MHTYTAQLEATQRGVYIDSSGKEVQVTNARKEIVEKIVEREVIKEVHLAVSDEDLERIRKHADQEKQVFVYACFRFYVYVREMQTQKSRYRLLINVLKDSIFLTVLFSEPERRITHTLLSSLTPFLSSSYPLLVLCLTTFSPRC